MAESGFSPPGTRGEGHVYQPSLEELADDIKPATCLGDKGHAGLWKGTYVQVKGIRQITDPDFPVSQVPALIQELQRQAGFLNGITHPNICRLFGISTKGDAKEIVVELMHETLQHRISCGPSMAAPTQLHVIGSIARALEYLHDRFPPIVCGCLTSGSVYISQDVLQVKIASVVISRTVEILTKEKFLEAKSDVTMEESLLSNPKADIGALGLLSAEVLSGRLFLERNIPTDGLPLVGRLNEILQQISRGHPLLSVITRSLGKEASRPNASEFVDITSHKPCVRKPDALSSSFDLRDETVESKHDWSALAGSEEYDLTEKTLSATVVGLQADVRNLQCVVGLLEGRERKRNDEMNKLRTLLEHGHAASKADACLALGQSDGYEESQNKDETASTVEAIKDVYSTDPPSVPSQEKGSYSTLESLAKTSDRDCTWVTTTVESDPFRASGFQDTLNESVLAVTTDFLLLGRRRHSTMLMFDIHNLSLVTKSRLTVPCDVRLLSDENSKVKERCDSRLPTNLSCGVIEGIVCLEKSILVTFVGGTTYRNAGFKKYLYSYDIKSNKWTLVSKTATSVCKSQMVASGNTIFYIGGADLTSPVLQRTDIVTTFNIQKQKWSTLNSMPTARVAPSCAVCNNNLYVAGGKTGYTYPWGRCNTCDVLNLETGTWRTISPTTMVGCAITAEQIGAVVATGGVKRLVETSDPQDFIEMFDHRTSKWVALPKMPTAIAFHESCSISNPDISILCAGGILERSAVSGRKPTTAVIENESIVRLSCSF